MSSRYRCISSTRYITKVFGSTVLAERVNLQGHLYVRVIRRRNTQAVPTSSTKGMTGLRQRNVCRIIMNRAAPSYNVARQGVRTTPNPSTKTREPVLTRSSGSCPRVTHILSPAPHGCSPCGHPWNDHITATRWRRERGGVIKTGSVHAAESATSTVAGHTQDGTAHLHNISIYSCGTPLPVTHEVRTVLRVATAHGL